MFVVITATKLPDHVRGYVSRFLVEVDQGVYVGTVSRRVRTTCGTGAVKPAERGE